MNLNAISVEKVLKNWFSPLMMKILWNAFHVERKMYPDYCLHLRVDQAQGEVSRAVHPQDVALQGDFPEHLREQP